MAGPFDSPSTAVGLPQKARMLKSPTPTTGAGEGVVFVSDGSGGLVDGDPYFRPENNGTPINILMGSPGPEDLAFTLLQGNTTGGSDIVMSSGDAIISENSGAGVPGRPIVLAPGSVVDTKPGALLWGTSYASLTRGAAAIDMQFERTAATQIVAANNDYAAIVGGRRHTISGTVGGLGAGFTHHSGIFVGLNNTITGIYTGNAVIVGGEGNLIRGYGSSFGPDEYEGSVIGSVIAGGKNNQIIGTLSSGSGAYHAFIGAGKNNFIGYCAYGSALFGEGNRVYGNYGGGGFRVSSCIMAGKNNTITDVFNVGGAYHSATFGEDNIIRGCQDAFAFGFNNYVGGPAPAYATCSLAGGRDNIVRAENTLVWGRSIEQHTRAEASAGFGEGAWLYSNLQWAIGAAGSVQGTGQACVYARRLSTTNATPTTFSATNRILLPPSRTWGFRIIVTARQTAGAAGTIGDSASWYITGLIKRDGANNTTLVGSSGTGTPTAPYFDAGAAAWTIAVAADDTNEALGITVTGELNKTITWSISVIDAEAG
jgi:hypothetical protein